MSAAATTVRTWKSRKQAWRLSLKPEAKLLNRQRPSLAAAASKASSAAHFFRQAEQGLHEGRALLKPVDWREEEIREESLVEKLEMLLSIILVSLDNDGDGAISKKDLASQRKALANKQKGVRTD